MNWNQRRRGNHEVFVYLQVCPERTRNPREPALQSDGSGRDELVSSCFSLLHSVEKLCHGLPNGNCPGR